jgi:hypothetical protein
LRGSVCRRRHSVEEVLQKPQDPVLGDEGQLEKHQHGLIFNAVLSAGWSASTSSHSGQRTQSTLWLSPSVPCACSFRCPSGGVSSSSSHSGQRTQSRLWLSPSVPCACSFRFPPWWCCFLEFSLWPADTIDAVAVSFSALCLFISSSSLWCLFLEFSLWPADTIEAVAVSFSALCLFISLSSWWCLFLELSLWQMEKSHLCGGLSQGDEQLE